MYKKFLFIAVIALFIKNNSFSQQTNTSDYEPAVRDTIKLTSIERKKILRSRAPQPLSRIGGTIGLQIIDANWNNGFGAAVFYHHTISRSWFVSANIAYNNYPFEVTEAGKRLTANISSLPITLGINLFLSHKGLRPYLGLELGYMDNKGNVMDVSYISSADIPVIFVLGSSLPVSKYIAIESNIRFVNTLFGGDLPFDLFNTGLNIGVSYMIP